MRIEVSVPGIRNERGKLPTPAAGPGLAGGACASWSRRCWRSSWLARKSANASALADGTPASNATTEITPPETAITAAFRFQNMTPPEHSFLALGRIGTATNNHYQPQICDEQGSHLFLRYLFNCLYLFRHMLCSATGTVRRDPCRLARAPIRRHKSSGIGAQRRNPC